MYLPPSTYAAVRDRWRSHCPWGACAARVEAGQYPDDYCYRTNPTELARFDDLTLHFGAGVSLRVGPLDYAYELYVDIGLGLGLGLGLGRRDLNQVPPLTRYVDVWCLGVFDNERSGGVIGASIMRHHEVIFDRQHGRIAFAPTNCKALHDGTVSA